MSKYYAEKLNLGLEFQDFIFDKLYEIGLPLISYSSKKYQVEKGENKAGFEIKYDMMFRKTGNFWIEVAEKSNPNNPKWIPSGIHRDDNAWLYIIGDYEEIYIFAKQHLLLIESQYEIFENKMKTSRGFKLPVKRSRIIAARVLSFGQK